MKHIIQRIFGKYTDTDSGRKRPADIGRDQFNNQNMSLGHQPFSLSPRQILGDRTPRLNQQKEPIFITARFRTGSTFLWYLFDQTEGVTAYYEPLHEKRWFLPSPCRDFVDKTHRSVGSYWQAYDGMEDLDAEFSDKWTEGRFYMDASSRDVGLETYINSLVSRAAGKPVLQFNRVDFRLDWLRARFPRARIVHLYRNPRDEWVSMLGHESACNTKTRLDEFADYDRFFLLAWARDLASVFPFLNLSGDDTPYALHYLIWRLSHSCGVAFADVSFSYETLVNDPSSVNSALLKAVGQSFDMEKYDAVCSPAEQGQSKKFADSSWYSSVEEKCEQILDAAFSANSPIRS